ncbi:MAG TPA: glycosyltransferase family 9 protein [Candidatus Rifleibacterium sp.]|nr:glycosyltransferase family 9 protein [Candidatus Rifleibacterium sp.]
MAPESLLVSRTDRAGDLLLTMAVFRELRKAFPDSRIVAHVRSYTAPLARLVKEIDALIVDDEHAPGFFSTGLANAFKEYRFACCVMVHPAGRALLAAWRAGIPKRIGRASNAFQLLLNDRRVQKRSRNEKHEYQYNLDLLQGLVNDIDYAPWHFTPEPDLCERGRAARERVGLNNCHPVIIHPGHGGSAHNISTSMYAAIVSELIKMQIPVLVSLGPGEEKLKEAFPEPVSGLLGFAEGIPDLAELAGVFSGCAGFCGGSTGPLHLAAALGLPCAAFFPPVAAMTPKRWGPAGCRSLIIKPEIADCNGRCTTCTQNGCMNKLEIHQATEWLAMEQRK